MSVYTDWFLAEVEDARAIALADDPFGQWPHLSLEGIGAIDLMWLWSALRGVDFNPGLDTSADLLYEGSEVSPFVFGVAPAFVAELAELTDRERVLQTWSKSEGLANWTPAEVATTLEPMVEFAKQSTRENKPVLELSTL